MNLPPQKTWKKDPDYCCAINKVEPLENIKEEHQVWISGLMSWQSDRRSLLIFLRTEEES